MEEKLYLVYGEITTVLFHFWVFYTTVRRYQIYSKQQ